MKIQEYSIAYIIVHIIPADIWATFSYQQKIRYHHLVTVNGKITELKKLEATDGCIEVVFVGSEAYANDSGVLFSLLLDLWVAHPVSKIMYAKELYNITSTSPIVKATSWLVKHMPVWIQRRFPKCKNLFTLHSLLPLIF